MVGGVALCCLAVETDLCLVVGTDHGPVGFVGSLSACLAFLFLSLFLNDVLYCVPLIFCDLGSDSLVYVCLLSLQACDSICPVLFEEPAVEETLLDVGVCPGDGKCGGS